MTNMAIDFLHVFDAAPEYYLLLAPDRPRFTIITVNDAYLHATHTQHLLLLIRTLLVHNLAAPLRDVATTCSSPIRRTKTPFVIWRWLS